MRVQGGCKCPFVGAMNFLGNNIKPGRGNFCWDYARRKKGPLHLNSMHTKLVRRRISKSCLSAALKKLCDHAMLNSFLKQVRRLRETSCAEGVIKHTMEDTWMSFTKKTKK